MGRRIEEGVAVLVKSGLLQDHTGGSQSSGDGGQWFVSAAEALFLPRDFNNK